MPSLGTTHRVPLGGLNPRRFSSKRGCSVRGYGLPPPSPTCVYAPGHTHVHTCTHAHTYVCPPHTTTLQSPENLSESAQLLLRPRKTCFCTENPTGPRWEGQRFRQDPGEVWMKWVPHASPADRTGGAARRRCTLSQGLYPPMVPSAFTAA